MDWNRLRRQSWDLWAGIVMPIVGLAGISENVARWVGWFELNPFWSGILVGSGTTLVFLHLWNKRHVLIQLLRSKFDHWIPLKERRLRRLFEVAPGVGKNAAALIRKQRTIEDGDAIFRTFMATPNRSDTAWAKAAQLRLRHDLLRGNDGDKAWVEAGVMEVNGEWTEHEWAEALEVFFGDIRGDHLD